MIQLISPRPMLLGLFFSLTIVMGVLTPTGYLGVSSAYAQAVGEPVSEEFVAALAPYGDWRRHPRWGDVWLPYNRPRDWRPYTYGRWVYTDDWGWYWISDDEEADWGWVTYHYGRWTYERRLGWFWVPGDEWAPAWVDWRRGDDYLGWAPLPPDELIDSDDYADDPSYWIFVEPRHITQVRLFTYLIPPQRAVPIFHRTVVVNRTLRHDRHRRRFAVNPGISPAIVAALGRNSVPTYRVRPRVFRNTEGIEGATVMRRDDFVRRRGEPHWPRGRRFQTEIQPTTVVVQPAPSVSPAEPLRRGERGRLGTRPPRAVRDTVQDSAPPLATPPATPATQQPPTQPSATPGPQERDSRRGERLHDERQRGERGERQREERQRGEPNERRQRDERGERLREEPQRGERGERQRGEPNERQREERQHGERRSGEQNQPAGRIVPNTAGTPSSPSGVVTRPPVAQPAPAVRQVTPPPATAPRASPAPVATPPGPPAHAPAAAPVRAQPPVRQAAPPHVGRPPAVQTQPHPPAQGRPHVGGPPAVQTRPPGPPAAGGGGDRSNEKQTRQHRRDDKPDQPK